MVWGKKTKTKKTKKIEKRLNIWFRNPRELNEINVGLYQLCHWMSDAGSQGQPTTAEPRTKCHTNAL